MINIFKSSFEETFATSSNIAEGWCLASEAASNPTIEVIVKSEYPTSAEVRKGLRVNGAAIRNKIEFVNVKDLPPLPRFDGRARTESDNDNERKRKASSSGDEREKKHNQPLVKRSTPRQPQPSREPSGQPSSMPSSAPQPLRDPPNQPRGVYSCLIFIQCAFVVANLLLMCFLKSPFQLPQISWY